MSTASKAPASTAQKAPVKAEGKTKKSAASKSTTSAAAADGEKKKRKKVRKETWSSYVYKGASLVAAGGWWWSKWLMIVLACSPQAGPPGHGYLQQGDGHPQLLRQRHLRAHCYRGVECVFLSTMIDRCAQRMVFRAFFVLEEVDNFLPRDPDCGPSHSSW